MFDSLIFDLDGTLWDSGEVVVKAWNHVLEQHGMRHFTAEDMHSVMGMQMPGIAGKLFPNEELDYILPIMEQCGDCECEMLSRQGGKLYTDLEDVIQQLSKRYKLLIVSNCQQEYLEAFFKAHGLRRYFADYEYAGNKGFTKGENIRKIIARNALKAPAYIGDTSLDLEAARFAGIPFILAAYGFGNVKEYDFTIDKPSDLLTLEGKQMPIQS